MALYTDRRAMLMLPKGRCAGKWCQGVYERCCPKAIIVSSDTVGGPMVMVATVLKLDFRCFQATTASWMRHIAFAELHLKVEDGRTSSERGQEGLLQVVLLPPRFEAD